MKTRIILLAVTLFTSLTISGQQLGDGYISWIPSNFNSRMLSGAYQSPNAETGFPDNLSHFQYKYLFNITTSRPSDPYFSQFQLASSFESNDRLFFRKMNANSMNAHWYEVATRSENTFTGHQTFRNNVYLSGTDGTTPFGQYGVRLYFGTPGDNMDDFYISRWNVANDQSELRINLGDDYNDKLTIGRKLWNRQEKEFTHVLVVATTEDNSGKVGINVYNPQYTLDVNGIIRAKEILVETGWADFVFDKDYKLPTLEEVESHIKEYKHLPGIPSEAEVKENGIGIADIATKLLQKVEELTLYTIQQQKTIDRLNSRIEDLENSKK